MATCKLIINHSRIRNPSQNQAKIEPGLILKPRNQMISLLQPVFFGRFPRINNIETGQEKHYPEPKKRARKFRDFLDFEA